MDTTWGTDDDLRTLLESLHVVTDAGTTNAGMALNVHEVTDGNNDLLDLLSQLTGWSQNQDAGTYRIYHSLAQDFLQTGQQKCSSFTATCFGTNQ